MNLNILWFILIGVLFTGYFVLDGIDLGVGILLPFLGRTDVRRRTLLNAIGPHWNGNEVWLLTAGGAIFAAFPGWYASLFSGFYMALLLILLGLIFRGVAIEFRSLDENPRWRTFWDWALFAGSLVPALLLGVAFANFMRGVPIDASQNYVGTFWNLLNPYALVGGLVSLFAFINYGALYLTVKTTGGAQSEAREAALLTWIPVTVTLSLFVGLTFFQTDLLTKVSPWMAAIPIAVVLLALYCDHLILHEKDKQAFFGTMAAVALAVVFIFVQLFPRVLVSSLDPAWSLTIYNTASGPYTLSVMAIVAAIFVPIVLVYQAWSFWTFRQRISEDPEKLTY